MNMRWEDYEVVSDKDWLITFILCFFLGYLGLHHFYCGKVGKGILFILTGGLFGIGILVNLILIVMKRYKDSEGRIVCRTRFFRNGG